jgi:aryl sulfotransferase
MREAQVRYRSIVADSARWEGFEFRDDDIVISTPPKCGTTWMQTICALLIFQTPELDASIDELSPWVDMLTRDRDETVAHLDSQSHRRFIKSHTPLDGLPFDERVTYICVGRDLRDVALSWDNHMANMDFGAFLTARQAAVGLEDVAELIAQGPPPVPDAEIDRFWAWVDEEPSPITGLTGLKGTLHHLDTFWQARELPNVHLFHYSDLQADLTGEMQRLADALGIAVLADRYPELVQAATFDQMRARADQFAPEVSNNLWVDNGRFFHRGTSGQWRRLLDDEGMARYRARAEAVADPDLLDWAHHGPIQ